MYYDQIVDQWDFFGKRHRTLPWKAILQHKVKKYWWHRSDLAETERNKLITAETYAECLERLGLVKAIRNAPSEDYANKLLHAACNHKEMPSIETVARGLRAAKADLEQSGYNLNRNNSQDTDYPEDFDELLVALSKATTNRDSGLEHRFAVYMAKAMPDIRLGHNEAISNGQTTFQVDFVSRKYGLVVELDSYEFHNDISSFIADRRRIRQLTYMGFKILPFTGSELTIKGGLRMATQEIKDFIAKLDP